MRFLYTLVLLLPGCALFQKPEDLAAIRATTEKLPQVVSANEKVYRDTIDGLTSELKKRAHAEVQQATDYEILKASLPKDVTFVGVTPEVLEGILKTKTRLDQEADTAIENLYRTAMDHQIHKDLNLIVQLLHDYLLVKVTDEEQRTEISTQAHDLIFKKKEVQ